MVITFPPFTALQHHGSYWGRSDYRGHRQIDAINPKSAGARAYGATLYPGKPARSIACCTNPEALACSINSLM